MFIESLKIHNYKRLFLSFINTLDYKPQARVNIILGKNGSGKSSTLKELTPIPANLTKDYEENGYKDIKITHNSKSYHLTSGIVAKNKHSFLVDHEELNPAGTRKVQLMLVKEHFNITPDIHNVLIGLKSFTTMSVMERKNWLTNISTVDYNYAISIFNKAKQRHRDIVGALKIAQGELTRNEDTIMDQEALDKIKTNISNLKEILIIVTESKTIFTNIQEIDYNIVNKIIDTAYIILNKLNKPSILTKGKDIDNEIFLLKDTIRKLTTDIEASTKALKDITFIEETKSKEDLTVVDSNLLKIKDKIAKLEDPNMFKVDVNSIESVVFSFEYIYQDLVNLLHAIEDNTVLNYDKTTYDNEVAMIANTERKLNELNLTIDKLVSDKKSMEHNRDHNEVNCAKCGNIWSIGYNPKEYKYICKKIEDLAKDIKELEDTKEKLSERASIFKNKIEAVNKFNVLVKRDNSDTLETIFTYFYSNSNIVNSPSLAVDLLFKINNHLTDLKIIPSLLKEYDDLLKDKDILEAKRKLELEYMNVNKNNVEDKLSKAIASKRELTITLNECEVYKTNITTLTNVSNQLITILRKHNKNLSNTINNKRLDGLNESIKILNLYISKLESLINDSELNRRMIEENKRKVKDLNLRKKATELIVTGLSPNHGLIAKSISQFLDIFISDMNNIINSVWNYTIEVLPCKVDDDANLDYKFEVKVDGRNIIEDVSNTSSSMQEIIDLAFKIVSMKYLRMEDYPLYLDEYAASFDAHHAIKAYDAIESLATSSFNQIFMITHYETTYTRFKDSDISVLDAENLLLNKDIKVNRAMTLS